jgi:hypothetical protein
MLILVFLKQKQIKQLKYLKKLKYQKLQKKLQLKKFIVKKI